LYPDPNFFIGIFTFFQVFVSLWCPTCYYHDYSTFLSFNHPNRKEHRIMSSKVVEKVFETVNVYKNYTNNDAKTSNQQIAK
jgi:hypothetical protein